MRPRLLAAAIAMFVPAFIGACSAGSTSATKDVTVAACTADPSGGHPVATGEITNGTSKGSTYVIHVTFADAAGNGVGGGAATLGKVEPAAPQRGEQSEPCPPRAR